MMKRCFFVLIAILVMFVVGCTVSTTIQPTPTGNTPTPTPFGETPDQIGNENIRFDVYQRTALLDLNMDGTNEEIEFVADHESSQLLINGTPFDINVEGLAQLFAITDVDNSDEILDIVFTDAYRALSGHDTACSYLYWWDGSDLIKMGTLSDVKFAGAFMDDFNPVEHFDGEGMVMYPVVTRAFTEIWYMGHFFCDGAERILEEDAYTARPINSPPTLTLKEYCVLLKHIDSTYFGTDYSVIWDYASGYSTLDRDYSDDIVSFIPRAGEELTIIRVYGAYWYKLQADDGKSGWLKCKDGKIQGYYQVMGYDASDIIDGL